MIMKKLEIRVRYSNFTTQIWKVLKIKENILNIKAIKRMKKRKDQVLR